MSSREETLAKIEAGEDAEDAIRDAAPEVQADKAVVLTAVAQYGFALRYASDEQHSTCTSAAVKSECRAEEEETHAESCILKRRDSREWGEIV
jgi:hypothetical protein